MPARPLPLPAGPPTGGQAGRSGGTKRVSPKYKRMIKKTKKNNRFNLLFATLITIVVVAGLQSQILISWGILDLSHEKPVVELDVLARLGVDANALEEDVTRLVSKMSNAQQGTHFILGTISGFIFSQPTAGLTVGLLKESLDFINNSRSGRVNNEYFVDAAVDTAFWALGGFVGFYVLSALYGVFQENNISGPKDLIVFVGKKFLHRNSDV